MHRNVLQAYQFSATVKELREFFWDSVCDWYIELTKPRMLGERGEAERRTAKQVLAFVMDQILRLFHPTLPFITERIWSELNKTTPQRGLPGITDLKADPMLILAEFPPEAGYPALDDPKILATFGGLQDATRGVRELRSQHSIPPKQKVDVTVAPPSEHAAAFEAQAHVVKHMAKIENLRVDADATRPKNAASIAVHGMRIFVHDISNDEAERARTTKSLAQIDKQIAGKEAKLGNEKFRANAKPEIVEAERERLDDLLTQKTSLQAHLADLEN